MTKTKIKKQSSCLIRNILLCLLTGAAGCGDAGKSVRIHSRPPGAAIWIEDELIGKTPCSISLAPAGITSVTARLPGYEDTTVSLAGSSVESEVWLDLPAKIMRTLFCSSEPAGAELFVNGEYVGVTPVEVSNLAAGRHQIIVRAKNREQVTQTVDLTAEESMKRVHLQLPSSLETFYLKSIQENTGELQHYADLIHHYILEHEFDKAGEIFVKGIHIASAQEVTGANRLWSEVHRVLVSQYQYGGAEEVEQAQKVFLRHLQATMKAAKIRHPMLDHNYIIALWETGNKAEARKVFQQAVQKYPKNQVLRRLGRQYNISAQ